MPKRKKTLSQASDVIRPMDEIPDESEIFLWLRVSGRTQKKRKNHADAEKSLRQEIETRLANRRCRIVEVFRHTGSGIGQSEKFCAVIKKALAQGAVLLAESTDRYVRHPDYHSKERPNLQAGPEELRALSAAAGGVSLFTLLDPDASPAEVRSYQRRRGQGGKNRKGGGDRLPGYKKRRNAKQREQVLKLWEQGYGRMQIWRKLGLAPTNVTRWIDKYEDRKNQK